MTGNKKRGHRTQHGPRPAPVVVNPHAVDNTLDEASDIGSVDGARDLSTSFPREGSVCFDSREGSGGFDSSRHDGDQSPSPEARGAARGGFGRGGPDRNPSPLRGDARGGFGSGRRPLPAASGGAARCERDRCDLEERGRIWKKTDFPTDDALRQCRVHRHEDLPCHIYLLLDILGLQFRWVLTRVGIGRTLVSGEERDVDDHKEHAWMALYANDRDVLEALLYRRLKTLWHACTDALAIFSKHRVGTELCGQKVWEALLSAFPLNHKCMQTVQLAREFSRLMAWDGHSKADVDRHFSDVSDSSIDMYNNDVGKKSAQKFMKQTGDLKAATLYFAS
jgi:hypothetical protein